MGGYITDYLGTTEPYYEKSGVHLEKVDYSLSLAAQYVDYLKGIETYES